MSLHTTASTSRDAFAIHKATGKLGAQQQQIVSFLRHRPYHAYTRSELAEATGIKLSAVCGRVNELLTEQGVLEELPRRVCSITGSSAHPVRLADAQGALF